MIFARTNTIYSRICILKLTCHLRLSKSLLLCLFRWLIYVPSPPSSPPVGQKLSGTYSSKQLQSKDFFGKPSDRRQFSGYSIAASEVCDGKNHNRTDREPETGGAEGSWKEGLDYG